MQIPTSSYREIYQDYVSAIAWMKDLGVTKLDVNRTARYEKLLRIWKDDYATASLDNAREVFPDFVSSMFEIYDIINIHKSFKNEPRSALTYIVKKLEDGVNGPINVDRPEFHRHSRAI